jgi:hypothetical protein
VNLIVIVESVRNIATKENDDLQKFHLPSIISVSVALGIRSPLDHDLALKLITLCQGLNSFCSSTAFHSATTPVKCASFGKITGTTCGSMVSV